MAQPTALLYHKELPTTTVFTIGTTPVFLNQFNAGYRLGVGFVDDSGFRIRLAGVYTVHFNVSFALTNGAEISVHVYKNNALTDYGSHNLGLSTIRNALSISYPDEFDIGDVIQLKAASDGNGRTLTIYDSQFWITGTN